MVNGHLLILSNRVLLQVIKIIFSAGYSALFMYVLFFARRRRHLTERYLNLIPVKGTLNDFRHVNPGDQHELYNLYCNLFGNIILYIPFPIILISLFPIINYKKAIFIAFFVSVGVELLQFYFHRGVADVDDVLLNTIGAIFGCMIYKAFLRNVKLN